MKQKFRTDKLHKQNKLKFSLVELKLTVGSHVNGWDSAVHLGYMSQNFCFLLIKYIRSKLHLIM